MRVYSILMLLAVTACSTSGSLDALRATKPSSDSFSGALASEYLAYAESLAEEGHPLRTAHFVQKGLDAAAGKDVPPEASSTLAREREALIALLTPDVKEVAPAKAARAQAMFDCWAAGTSLCADSFTTALSDLAFIGDALVHEDDNRYVAQFANGSSVLSENVNAVLDIVARRVSGLGEYQVELMAYANKPKAGNKIKLLASRRVLALEKGLIARGVNAGRIHKHQVTSGSEVFLSVDEAGDSRDSVGIAIQTFGQPVEVKSP